MKRRPAEVGLGLRIGMALDVGLEALEDRDGLTRLDLHNGLLPGPRATGGLAQRPGGWPLTVFLTPDQLPFFAGTYFPKEPRYGMTGFPELLGNIAD